MRLAWLHLALTAMLTLGITTRSRSVNAMAQALMVSCSSLLQTSQGLFVLCAAALHPRLATLLPHVLAPASLPCPQAPPPFSSWHCTLPYLPWRSNSNTQRRWTQARLDSVARPQYCSALQYNGSHWPYHQRQRSTDIHKPNLCLVAYGRYAHKQGKNERQRAEAECQ